VNPSIVSFCIPLLPLRRPTVSFTESKSQTHHANLERVQSIVQRMIPSISWTFSRRGYDDRKFPTVQAGRLITRFRTTGLRPTVVRIQRRNHKGRGPHPERCGHHDCVPKRPSRILHRVDYPWDRNRGRENMGQSRCSNVSRGQFHSGVPIAQKKRLIRHGRATS
jgi:hypothetical protein